MKFIPSTRIALLLLLAVMPATAVEHPGVLPADSDCSSCHAKKTSGKSVHSAMSTSCTVCHVVRTQGDMTTLNLAMPKEQICFACHEKSAEVRQHLPVVKGVCVDCHDAHSSDQPMLLRASAGLPLSTLKSK
ncbi:MAG: cytochrome c3 family protein [Candidatus Sulfotelmatobacter sp.]